MPETHQLNRRAAAADPPKNDVPVHAHHEEPATERVGHKQPIARHVDEPAAVVTTAVAAASDGTTATFYTDGDCKGRQPCPYDRALGLASRA